MEPKAQRTCGRREHITKGMGTPQPSDVYIALIHHPVVNKKGDVIASAVTNLDLHDIARAARTYGVKGYYVVNPLEDQVVLADKIVRHWSEGDGGRLNPARQEAFRLIRITRTLDEAIDHIRQGSGKNVRLFATSARKDSKSLSFADMRHELACGDDILLLFGTAWGLSSDVMDQVHGVLEPLKGKGDYNHLSVRSAVSIILDRLMGVTQ